ncbi:hypothetical protein [Ruegeria arenilitoris]|uniref:hypothetical protein n=1 Tax=Ruegeria arenilitoris TaxID=1173585 RepID=UPI00148016C3|nr:hypothetical protein [Ruegeria arenilitoris]
MYYATGGWLFLTVMAGVYYLFQAMLPSADVASVPRPAVYTLDVENFEPGQSAMFRLDEVPVIIWRRNFEQKVQALELLGFEFNSNASLLDEVRANEEIEIEPDRVLRFEWFVVSPINTGGYGCIVRPVSGDLGGFYDPCEDVHFDLWGRVGKGPTEVDLQVLPWSISDDRSAITVDVSNAPRLEW